MIYLTGSGRIELQITKRQAAACGHPGLCDADVLDLSQVSAIRRQLERIDPALLAEELREWGAWDADELADHAQNLQRILWLACCDIDEAGRHDRG
jgi:hypothetical protein